MRILVFGASGFIGQNLVRALQDKHEVYAASREGQGPRGLKVDLLQPESIAAALTASQPDVIVNAAGIVANTPDAQNNVTFTMNILQQVTAQGLNPQQIIVCGSAAEYGQVVASDIPTSETAPLKAVIPYAVSKKQEAEQALAYGQQHRLKVTIARIFNPIGVGMHERFLVPGLIRQINDIKSGKSDHIEVSRLDALRDYIDISDLTTALICLIEGDPKQTIYNIGSGRATSNGDLIEAVLAEIKLPSIPPVTETASEPEPPVASQADITRIRSEFGWQPHMSVKQTVKEIINDTKHHQ